MEAFTDGKAVRAGTYSGNPVACAAVLATLAELVNADYENLIARGDALRRSLAASFDGAGLPASTNGYGDVFSIWFNATPPHDYSSARRLADSELSLALHVELRQQGVLVMPSAFGRLYLSFAHDREALAILESAVAAAAPRLAQRRIT